MPRFSASLRVHQISSPASAAFFLWMVATLCSAWLVAPKRRPLVLVVATSLLLGYFDWRSLVVLASVTGLCGVVLKLQVQSRHGWLLPAGALILAVLSAYKLAEAVGPSGQSINRIVPLGMSYYSLRCVHLLMEAYIGRICAPQFSRVVSYLFFPATIVAGPIHRYPSFVAEEPSRLSTQDLSHGLERILYGYVKILVLSNYLLTMRVFGAIELSLVPGSGLFEYFDAVQYGITLYLQFSGYSDIAIGFSLLLGHRVIENFSWPLLRTNIVDFWRSWHISLTSLCREYVFTSVFASTRKAWLGVIATMLAISLWHGLTLSYLCWGIYHAVGVVVYQQWSRSRAARACSDMLPRPVALGVGWFLTFQFVMLGFVWTKEVTVADSAQAYASIAAALF